MIEAIDLTVRRRGRIILDAVSFDVRPGQVTGVLGGTGSGKTTLLRRMVQLERGGGETLFDGRPYRSLRHPMREVGLLLEAGVGHPDRTVRGQLRLALATDRRSAREGEATSATDRRLVGSLTEPIADSWLNSPGHSLGPGRLPRPGQRRGLGDRLVASRRGSPAERIDAVLDIVGLADQRNTRLADLTDGMATRLSIAIALLGDPKALLFDNPERGLEPEGVAWLGALLRAFTGQGRAALVTGSDTETLVRLADRILLLDSGYLVGTRTTEEVLRAPTGAAVIVRSPQIVRFAAILAEAGARSAQGDGACLEVRGLDRARVGDLAYRHSVPVHELSERFTGSDPADVVLAACSGRNRPIVPIQGFPENVSARAVGTFASGNVTAVLSSGPEYPAEDELHAPTRLPSEVDALRSAESWAEGKSRVATGSSSSNSTASPRMPTSTQTSDSAEPAHSTGLSAESTGSVRVLRSAEAIRSAKSVRSAEAAEIAADASLDVAVDPAADASLAAVVDPVTDASLDPAMDRAVDAAMDAAAEVNR